MVMLTCQNYKIALTQEHEFALSQNRITICQSTYVQYDKYTRMPHCIWFCIQKHACSVFLSHNPLQIVMEQEGEIPLFQYGFNIIFNICRMSVEFHYSGLTLRFQRSCERMQLQSNLATFTVIRIKH